MVNNKYDLIRGFYTTKSDSIWGMDLNEFELI